MSRVTGGICKMLSVVVTIESAEAPNSRSLSQESTVMFSLGPPVSWLTASTEMSLLMRVRLFGK